MQFPDLCEGGVPRHELPGAICGDDRLCISIRVGPGPDLCREIGIRCPLNTRLVCDQGCGDNSCIGRCCNCLPEASVSDLLCGNGVLDPGESCDDANNVDIDACSNDCRLGVGQSCVNAVSCVTDICRDNVCAPCVADDECRSLVCQDGRCLPLCGNGMRDPGEECDDGNRSNADACTNECYRSNDQPCAVGEECQSGLCRGGICSPCNRHEECGQKLCIRRQCQRSPVVGNGIVEFGEECDDGNTDDGDGCTSRGTIPPSDCGNGVLDAGEECDQGGDNSAVTPDRCRMDCRNPRCGDGIADSTEQCDDGNGVAGDGCDRLCRIELRALAVDLPWNPFLGNVGSVALTRPPAGQTGPAALVFMAAGGAAAWAAMRRRRR